MSWKDKGADTETVWSGYNLKYRNNKVKWSEAEKIVRTAELGWLLPCVIMNFIIE